MKQQRRGGLLGTHLLRKQKLLPMGPLERKQRQHSALEKMTVGRNYGPEVLKSQVVGTFRAALCSSDLFEAEAEIGWPSESPGALA